MALEPAVEHEPGRFFVRVGGGEAYLTYEERPGVLEVQHTFTPPDLRGRNLAAALTEAAFAHARARRLRVVPTCSYTRRYVERHPELRALTRPA
jgi:hypothetical protein